MFIFYFFNVFQLWYNWICKHLWCFTFQNNTWAVVRKVQRNFPIGSQRKRLAEMRCCKCSSSPPPYTHLTPFNLLFGAFLFAHHSFTQRICGSYNGKQLPDWWLEQISLKLTTSISLFFPENPNFCQNGSKLPGRSAWHSEITAVLWCWKTYLVFGVFLKAPQLFIYHI